jgi:UDP-N-acetylmuramoyl-L-alanyl-D-glutamate--2,6-diaminopimelate ligase
VAIINRDDWWGRERLASSVQGESTEVHLYGLEEGTIGYRAEDLSLRAGETTFEWVAPAGSVPVRMPLTGKVNLYNWLAASAAALARGLSVAEVVRASTKLDAAPGRFEVVPGSGEAGFVVVVDYAHTDDALKNLIGLARDLVGEGRVITMFGCGGDRDRTKRPKMGRVAAEGSDVVVVTSDNPRSEDPMSILEEVLVGVREVGKDAVIELDRHKAIERAIREARPGDIVLLAGKGHEKTQTFADRTVEFDDVAEAAKVLREVMH